MNETLQATEQPYVIHVATANIKFSVDKKT